MEISEIKKFSVPADFNIDTLKAYTELNKKYEHSKVSEVYGNITLRNGFGSGRSVDMLPKVGIDQLKNYVDFAKQNNIDFSYTLNSSHMKNEEFTKEGIIELLTFLKKIRSTGVENITIALPSLMDIVNRSGLGFKIKASVICQITNPNKAICYKKLGVDRIVADESVNRDFDILKELNKIFEGQVEVIVNTICLNDCVYRMFHYNQVATDSVKVTSKVSSSYYPNKCLQRRFDDFSNIIKMNWIRPEDIKYYEAIGIRRFKLQGRHTVFNGESVKTLEAYFKENFDGDLMELFDFYNSPSEFKIKVDNRKLDGFVEAFFNKKIICKNNCPECRYCDSYAKKAINYDLSSNTARAAGSFFESCDEFSSLYEKVNSCAESKIDNFNSVDFDFN
jgi:collagenase-like PrtC family protease